MANKMEQIINSIELYKKALNYCVSSKLDDCDECPFSKQCESGEFLGEYALNIMNNLNAEIKRLKNAYKQCAWERDVFFDKDTEIERLNKEVDRLSQVVLYHDGQISDARKEFAEELKTRIKNALFCYYDIRFKNQQELLRIIVAKIDNLLKEMETGDTKK